MMRPGAASVTAGLNCPSTPKFAAMKLVFFGTPQFAVPSLVRLLAEPGFDVVAVVTQPDRRRGRGKQLVPSAVKQAAADCPVWQPERIKRDRTTIEQLAAVQADAFVVVAYGQILSPEILALPRLGCINAHGSLLPHYRGAAPIQWSLYHGETTTGVTTMQMDAGMDTGPMLLKQAISIDLFDQAHTLAETLAQVSADLLVKTLHQLKAGDLVPQPQDDAAATYAPLIQKSDYRLDWGKSAIALHNHVRGFFPNAVTLFRGDPLKISATVPLGPGLPLPDAFAPLTNVLRPTAHGPGVLASTDPPGTILALPKNYGPIIQTGDGCLLLHQVKPMGKGNQSGWDFANGNRLMVGDQLGQGIKIAD